jgi:hypothetical protein
MSRCVVSQFEIAKPWGPLGTWPILPMNELEDQMLPTGNAKLYWLIELYMSGHHDVGTFCKEFEHTYNFEIDRAELSAAERSAFGDLFSKVTMYSPLQLELQTIPVVRAQSKSEKPSWPPI